MSALTRAALTAPAAVRRGTWPRRFLLGAVLAYVALLLLAPVTALLVGAFSAGIDGIASTFGDHAAQAALALSLQIALIATAVNGLFGTIVAWALVRHRFPGRRLLIGLMDLPFALSPVVAGYMLIVLFGRLSPLAPLEDALNLQIVFAVPGMVLATIFVTLPFMIGELMPVIASLDREQERAAATLGSGPAQRLRLVILPALRGAIFYGLVLTFARALGEFGAVLVVGGGIQGQTETAPLYIFRALDSRNDAAAYSMALALGLTSLALALGIEWFRRREHR